MTGSLFAHGREVFRNVARTPNGLSNKYLVFGPYYLGTLLFAGHGEGGGVLGRLTEVPRPPTKATIVRKNEIYHWENLVGPFLVHKPLVPRPPSPLLSSNKSLPLGGLTGQGEPLPHTPSAAVHERQASQDAQEDKTGRAL